MCDDPRGFNYCPLGTDCEVRSIPREHPYRTILFFLSLSLSLSLSFSLSLSSSLSLSLSLSLSSSLSLSLSLDIYIYVYITLSLSHSVSHSLFVSAFMYLLLFPCRTLYLYLFSHTHTHAHSFSSLLLSSPSSYHSQFFSLLLDGYNSLIHSTLSSPVDIFIHFNLYLDASSTLTDIFLLIGLWTCHSGEYRICQCK